MDEDVSRSTDELSGLGDQLIVQQRDCGAGDKRATPSDTEKFKDNSSGDGSSRKLGGRVVELPGPCISLASRPKRTPHPPAIIIDYSIR
jgi:hypothetical protein